MNAHAEPEAEIEMKRAILVKHEVVNKKSSDQQGVTSGGNHDNAQIIHQSGPSNGIENVVNGLKRKVDALSEERRKLFEEFVASKSINQKIYADLEKSQNALGVVNTEFQRTIGALNEERKGLMDQKDQILELHKKIDALNEERGK